jgi:hypothetical protein
LDKRKEQVLHGSEVGRGKGREEGTGEKGGSNNVYTYE